MHRSSRAPPSRPVAPAKAPEAIAAVAQAASRPARHQRIRWALLRCFRSPRRSLLVRHRWPDHVDRRRLCSRSTRSASRPMFLGIVQDVGVGSDNQHVTAGQVLYRLDHVSSRSRSTMRKPIWRRPHPIEIDETRLQADPERHRGSAGAELGLDRVTFDRYAQLLSSSTAGSRRPTIKPTTRCRRDLRRTRLRRSSSKRSRARQARRQSGHRDHRASRNICRPRPRSMKLQRELDHTVAKSAVAPASSQRAPSHPASTWQPVTAFYLVATDHAWVEPDQEQMTYVRPGQPVTVSIDTYPDVQWHGTVESIGPAGAQEFQLLPAQTPAETGSSPSAHSAARAHRRDGFPGLPPAAIPAWCRDRCRHRPRSRPLPHLLTALFDRSRESVMTDDAGQARRHRHDHRTGDYSPAMMEHSTTIVNVALPYVQGSLAASQDQIDWVLTSYITATAVMTQPTGFWRALRPQAPVHGVDARLRIASMLCGMADWRHRSSFSACCRAFGAGRCAGADGPAHDLPERASWVRDGAVQQHRRRPCPRTRARRLAHRELRGVVPYQPGRWGSSPLSA